MISDPYGAHVGPAALTGVPTAVAGEVLANDPVWKQGPAGGAGGAGGPLEKM